MMAPSHYTLTRITVAAVCGVLGLAASACERAQPLADAATQQLTNVVAPSTKLAYTAVAEPQDPPQRQRVPPTTKRARGFVEFRTEPRDASGPASMARLAIDTEPLRATTPSVVPNPVTNDIEEPDSPVPQTPVTLTAPDDESIDDDTTVYSIVDREVLPPTLLTRGFLGPLLSGANVRRTAIELAISKTGAVERVRLVSSPSQNMRDTLFLSRAKQFQFRPASKNGVPVQYRLVIVVEEAAP